MTEYIRQAIANSLATLAQWAALAVPVFALWAAAALFKAWEGKI